MQGNIVGEKFDEFVLRQIKERQKVHYSGYGAGTTRSPQDQLYLNNRNAWVKLASGISIEGFEGSDKLKRVIPNSNFSGENLAKNFILFNTVSSLITNTDDQSKNTLSNNRSGVTKTNSIWNNKAYGLGGTEFGINPTPGITDVQIACVNRGSIRNATITLTAFNKSQFEIIELLFLRIGYTMILEWGWDKYLNNDGNLVDTGTTIVEESWFEESSHQTILEKIQTKRDQYCGNYDGFIGKVVNFDWTLNSEGNYEIILKLVTVGDVIESLNVNTGGGILTIEDLKAYNEQVKATINEETGAIEIDGAPEDTKILQLGKHTTFSYQFINDIGSPILWDNLDLTEWRNLAYLIKGTQIGGDIDIGFNNTAISFKNEKYQYFLSFKLFISRIKKYLIPFIKSKDGNEELMLEIDGAINDTLITYSPYIIPFDPKISIFKAEIPDTLNGSNIFINEDIKKRYTEIFSKFPRFKVERNGQNYGLLMNMYLNYDFIANCLESNTDNEGKLSLFKFLQAICSGINSSLANTTKLKPILKDDKVITIVDDNFHQETPIPEIDGEEVKLNSFGYNTTDKSSNFLRDISFQTNITPELASMITIGATAGGSTTREVDGTAFGKWNEGLKDRYQYEISDIRIKNQPDYIFREDPEFEDFISWYRNRRGGASFGAMIRFTNSYRDRVQFGTAGNLREVNKEKLQKYLKEKQRIQRNEANKLKKDFTRRLERNLGAQYVKLFSGTARVDGKSIEETSNSYFSLDGNVISQTKAVYKAWLNYTNNKFLKDKQIASNQTGFLPLQVGLTLDGMSGIKIYNELLINQGNILPYYYPKTLKFIITQVNHSITGNDWTISLDTLSQPKIVTTTKEIEEEIENSFIGPLEQEEQTII